MNIVYRVQAIGQKFPGHIQMAQVGPRVMATGVAGAGWVRRFRIGSVAGICDVKGPTAREHLAVARIAGRQYAVEHIGP